MQKAPLLALLASFSLATKAFAAEVVLVNTSQTETLVAAAVFEELDGSLKPMAAADGFWEIAPGTSRVLRATPHQLTKLWLRVIARKGENKIEFPALNREHLRVSGTLCTRAGKSFDCLGQTYFSASSRKVPIVFGEEENFLKNAFEKGQTYSFFNAGISGSGHLEFHWK